MAVREINLVPSEWLFPVRVRRHLAFWLLCLACTLALMGGGFLFATHVVLAPKRPAMGLEQLQRDLGMEIQEIRRVQQELERLRERKAVVASITLNQPYSLVLERLAHAMNDHCWLTHLEIDSGRGGGGKGRLQLTGLATSNQDLGDFLTQLGGEPLFEEVVLRFAGESVTRSSGARDERPVARIHFRIELALAKG